MRDHAIVSPQFWTGETGRYLRACGPDAQRVALYLLTSPNSTMIGLYYLPIPTLCHEVGISPDDARKALQRAFEGGFAAYDEVTETVFVVEMARFQIGDQLKPKDNRIVAVERIASLMCKSPFYKDFLERYRVPFNLQDVPNPTSPFKAPSKPLLSQDQDQDQDQGKEQEVLSACADGANSGKRASANTRTPSGEGRPAKAAVADAGESGDGPEKAPRKRSARKEPAKPEHGEVKTYFCELWKAKRGRAGADYAWKHGKDDAHTKWILDQVGRDIAKAKQIIEDFIDDDEPWLADRGHDIGLLVSRFNKYRARREPEASGTGFIRGPMTKEIAADLDMPWPVVFPDGTVVGE